MSVSKTLDIAKLPISIFDNGGKTFDRFSVVYKKERERNGLY